MKKFLSRKFILVLVGAVIYFLNGYFEMGIDSQEMLFIFGMILSYLGFEGTADIISRIKNK